MDEAGNDSHDHGIDQIPDTRPRNTGHRRTHSEIISLSDGNDNDDDELFFMLKDMEKFNSSCEEISRVLEGEPLEPHQVEEAAAVGASALSPPPCSRLRHQHGRSMDESSSFNSQLVRLSMQGLSPAETRKAMSVEKLANIALVDPKRAKRMWENRQSAARSKERKIQYKAELERRVQALQTETTMLATKISLVENDIIGLTAENSEMKLYLQSIKQQIHFQDALNDALKEEIKWLRIATSQMSSNDGAIPMMNLGEPSYEELQQFYHHHSQGRQLQILPQHQLTPEGHHPLLQPTLYLQQQQQALGDLRMKGPLVSQTTRHEKIFDHNNNNGSYNN
ncbi:transcription factor RF2a-like [Typha latifolia]|uniref:transcription factor RF2a-like n=1 Tax=Typha latifolia TaxID=4733 RepID=UPI003C2CE536